MRLPPAPARGRMVDDWRSAGSARSMAGMSEHCRLRSPTAVRFALAVVALLAITMPRADACTVDDDLDVASEGLLSSFAVAESRGPTKSMSCKLLVRGPHTRVTTRRTASPADIARA